MPPRAAGFVTGPVRGEDAAPEPAVAPGAVGPELLVVESRRATVGAMPVRRALPTRGRRTVGAWCFVDHAGPVVPDGGAGPAIGPHPHIGLHTVTWVMQGELCHRDSLGSEQVVRPGELNLMTAGRGIAHAEEGTGHPGPVHLAQLWVAQPSTTRDGPPAFAHHADLPRLDLGSGTATVLVGSLGPAVSPARCDTELVGVDLELRPGVVEVGLDPRFEHVLVVTAGRVETAGRAVVPGQLAYLGTGRDQLALSAPEPARLLLLGGLAFPEPLLMWWNLVARTRDEIEAAYADWTADSDRFGPVASSLPRVTTAPPPWTAAGR
jgi:redox-sensitive bicupin YhaK (pirin superfamily)